MLLTAGRLLEVGHLTRRWNSSRRDLDVSKLEVELEGSPSADDWAAHPQGT